MTLSSAHPTGRWVVPAMCGVLFMQAGGCSRVADELHDGALPDESTHPPPAAQRHAFAETADAPDLGHERVVVPSGPLAQRYRLAGTYLSQQGEDHAGSESARQAILDDLKRDRQVLVREGDRLDDQTEVVSIHRDRIWLLAPSGPEELLLEYTGTSKMPDPSDTARRADDSAPDSPEDSVLERNRFGERVAEYRWVFEREALIQYADELQADPERLAALFLAMQPVYNERERVRGFQLSLLDEDILYKAAGLQEGDIVLQVNSLEMNSAARAEYYLYEFLNDHIREFVFEIERHGEKRELIYRIR